MKVISHSADADGRLSAFLVAKYYNLTNQEDFIMLDYGDGNTTWLSQINQDEDVVICDFGFENKSEDMLKLLQITRNIIWIDHHESTINDYGEMEKDIAGVRVNGTAACMLTYIYFYIIGERYPNTIGKRIELTQEECEKFYQYAPLLVRLVHDNDVWRYQYGNVTSQFKLGLDSENIISPIDDKWNKLFEDESEVYKLVGVGEHLVKYRDSLGSFACDHYGFEIELCGKKGFALNNCMGGSPWFVDKIKEYDFVCSFVYIGNGKWEYSFYSDKTDRVSCFDIAKSLNPNGGGHKGAAGCTLDKFIF
jgi:uncharacterized protein